MVTQKNSDDKKLIRRWHSEHELSTTTSYYKIRKLRYNLSESLQKLHHGKIRLITVEFENNTM